MSVLQSIMEDVSREMNLDYFQCAVTSCKIKNSFYSLHSVLVHCLESHPNEKQVGKWKKCFMKAPADYETEQYYKELCEFNRKVEENYVKDLRERICMDHSKKMVTISVQTDSSVHPSASTNKVLSEMAASSAQKRKAFDHQNLASATAAPLVKRIKQENTEQAATPMENARQIPLAHIKMEINQQPSTQLVNYTSNNDSLDTVLAAIKREILHERVPELAGNTTRKEFPVLPLLNRVKQEVANGDQNGGTVENTSNSKAWPKEIPALLNRIKQEVANEELNGDNAIEAANTPSTRSQEAHVPPLLNRIKQEVANESAAAPEACFPSPVAQVNSTPLFLNQIKREVLQEKTPELQPRRSIVSSHSTTEAPLLLNRIKEEVRDAERTVQSTCFASPVSQASQPPARALNINIKQEVAENTRTQLPTTLKSSTEVPPHVAPTLNELVTTLKREIIQEPQPEAQVKKITEQKEVRPPLLLNGIKQEIADSQEDQATVSLPTKAAPSPLLLNRIKKEVFMENTQDGNRSQPNYAQREQPRKEKLTVTLNQTSGQKAIQRLVALLGGIKEEVAEVPAVSREIQVKTEPGDVPVEQMPLVQKVVAPTSRIDRPVAAAPSAKSRIVKEINTEPQQ